MTAKLLDNPEIPYDDDLWGLYNLAAGKPTLSRQAVVDGLRAIWRAGADAGMMHTLTNGRVEATPAGYGKIEIPTQEQIVRRFGSLSSFALARLIQIAQNTIDERIRDGVVD